MPDLSRRFAMPSATLLVGLCLLVGCGTGTPPPPIGNVGTTSMVGIPESTPPVLTKAVADRIRTGMAQGEVLGILRDASLDTPSAKSLVELASTQSKMNSIRYNLTIVQGKRRLALAFKDEKLVAKTTDGLD
jgi:hypothetical protein